MPDIATPPPTETCRALLLRIAAYLDRSRPTSLMWPASRELLAGQFAAEHYGIRTDLVAEIEAELLAHAPGVTPGTRRKQYAKELRRAAGLSPVPEPPA
ncbi:hypothetical protein [Streptomyces sp. NRRL S-241]|uniref:hypothetical protein n=1 Tax=Streptomyces sp. NRRL S-241 TaxID=1463896 RepID=UPI0004C270BD|nr:hypothetical protein [Streptomyces sp. NRRL S-241]